MKLAGEYRGQLRDIMEAGQWPAVLALIEVSLAKHEENLKSCDIGNNSRELTLRKARLEGVTAVKNLFESLHAELKDK